MSHKNSLYFGDNLNVLRESIADATVDLVYLDPPFNSARDYNILFSSPKGEASEAQITAFEDSWHWGEQAEREFNEIMRQGNTDVAEMMGALRKFLGENDMMAYLTMMANRLLEMHRVLKPTGSLYLHCDPTASHYLKVVLDGVFGKTNYRSEISWKRSSAHNDAKQGRKQYGNIRDVIYFYTKSNVWNWNWLYTEYDENYINSFYRHVEVQTGRRYQLDNLTGPGGAAKGNPSYEVMGVTRFWRYSKEKMQALISEGRIVQTSPGTVPRFKRYLDEMHGVALQNDWDDIQPAQGKEFLGYPTQKPVALLERIIQASSNEGDVVLDPFCGCGTAVHAAQKLNRKWIGIDITHLAVSLIEKRLRDAFPDSSFEVEGTPKDLGGARNLADRDKYQFQWWACSLVNAQPHQGKKKGADGGIDGLIYFQDGDSQHKKIVVSVKGGENVSVAMVRDLAHVVGREKAEIGLFVTLATPTKPMNVEAIKEGYYESPMFAANAFPKIQILTIEGLLSGTERALYPDLTRGSTTFKKTKREEKKTDQSGLF
jgi:DNA modification methylase